MSDETSGARLHDVQPDCEIVNGKKIYHCGTLTYTKFGLVSLFVWMLWGDFCYTLMEQLIPTLLPIELK